MGKRYNSFSKKEEEKAWGQKVEFSVVFVANWVLVWYDRKDYIEEEYTEGEYYVNKQAESLFARNGITPELRDTVYHALEARELVKISVLDNNMLGAREAAEMLASRTGAEVVQVIGNKFVLYRAAKKPVIELPQAKK